MHDLVTIAAAELDDTAVDERVPDIEPVPAARGFGRASVALHIAGIAIAMAFDQWCPGRLGMLAG